MPHETATVCEGRGPSLLSPVPDAKSTRSVLKKNILVCVKGPKPCLEGPETAAFERVRRGLAWVNVVMLRPGMSLLASAVASTC